MVRCQARRAAWASYGGAILLEEPMFGPRIRIDGGRPARSPEIMLHLGDRLSRLEGVILRVMEEVGGRSFAIVQSGVGAIKDHDGGDLLGQGDGHVQRVGVSEREANKSEFTVTACLCRFLLAQDL